MGYKWSHVFPGQQAMFFWGEAGRVRVAHKERNKVTTMWEIQAQGKNHQGASVCTAVTDRLTNTAKDITAFTQSWGFPQKVRAGLGGEGAWTVLP